MNTALEFSSDGSRLTVSITLTIRKRGGRKVVVAPDEAAPRSTRQRIDSTLVKTIARAYRWQRMLEQGTYASIRDLAAAEKISPTYVSRLLRLTLLPPRVVEAALDGRLRSPMSEQWLSQQIVSCWDQQRFITAESLVQSASGS